MSILLSNPAERRDEEYIVLPIVTAPKGSLGKSLKIWYYFVFGFVVAVVVAMAGAGGGIIIPPTGLIAAKGFRGIIGAGCDIANGTLMTSFSSFYFYFSFFFFRDILSLDRDLSEDDELEPEDDDSDRFFLSFFFLFFSLSFYF